MEKLEYITQKALIKCSNGAAPGFFTPTYNTSVKINGCLVATAMDKAPMANIPTFVICSMTQQACAPLPSMWQDTYPVKIKGEKALLGRSCIQCSVGGKIEFLSSGQIPLSKEDEDEVNNTREDVKKAHEEELEEANKSWWQKAGEFALDMVPIVGPIVSFAKNVSDGNFGMAGLDVVFLAIDVVGIVGAPFSGGLSLAATTAAKAGLRATVKGALKATAKKMGKESIQAGMKQASKILSKLSVKELTRGAICVFACFPKGTLVHTKDGFRNIEDVKNGDLVWSWNEEKDEVVLRPVIKTISHEVDILIKLVVDQEEIETTPDHPFYSDGEWIEAGNLEVGDEIRLIDGNVVIVNEINFIIDSEGLEGDIDFSINNAPNFDKVFEGRNSIQVFNFEVEENESYFVSKLKVLVHNGKICLKGLSDDAIKEIRIAMLKKGYRPKFRKGVVDDVWKLANRNANGDVICPSTNKILTWDKAKSRWNQWQMGHKPEFKWSNTVAEFKNGKITWKELLDKYNVVENYHPEDPIANMSHLYE
jgi:hypothetical protein